MFRTFKFNRNRVHRDRFYRITDVDGAAEALVAAKSVVIVPGYGLGEDSYTEILFRIYRSVLHIYSLMNCFSIYANIINS